MLGEGGDAPAVPEEELRRAAGALLAQVEGRPVPKPPEPNPEPRRRLFSRAAPLAAPEVPAPMPAQPLRESIQPEPEPSLPKALPEAAARRRPPPLTLPTASIRALVAQGLAVPETEHPAIVALSLDGKPPLAQADALRALPRGQARSVHRALRMLATGP
jgi:hypothetical protein